MSAPELQQEIERTRAQLGQTIDELAAKADLKARARDKAAEVRAKAREKATRAQHKALQARDRSRDKAVELSGRVRKSPAAELHRVRRTVIRRAVLGRMPLSAAVGVLAVAGTVAVASVVLRRWLRK